MKTKDYSMREMIIDQCLGTGREYTREELQAAVNKALEHFQIRMKELYRTIEQVYDEE